jgi:hypothetical protein
MIMVWGKNANIFAENWQNRRKLAKIAENCDHNIDPWGQCSGVNVMTRKIFSPKNARQIVHKSSGKKFA